ncbi:hypothetical protein GCM10022631_11560 [Deinococcus rubellus]|uniref:Uncharacterized protein n=1 Tax=Deinococcus rubellus TaxID=1889240 RepID=A0ABY5YES9_9DEIO|nr:hypothetical protein [Deinococcus rubellus]UWX62799.1 hypothetical protein N0D28_08430 [Deinococcus rubellus]
MKKTLILGMLLLAGTAAAQADGFGFDLTGLSLLGSSPAALAAVVFGVNSTIKRNISVRYAAYEPPRKEPPAPIWWALSTVLGVIGGVVLYFSNLGGSLPLFGLTGWPTSIFFGLAAGLTAVIGRDGTKTVLGWIGNAAPPAVIVPSTGGLEAIPLLGFPAAEPPQDDADFPAATRTDWPALHLPDDAPLADSPVDLPPAVIVAAPVQETP